MKVLTLNSGSSSLKYKLFAVEGLEPLASGVADRIGDRNNRLVSRQLGDDGTWKEAEFPGCAPDHATALEQVFKGLGEQRLLRSRGELVGVGHRVVHGGERFVAPVVIDDEVVVAIHHLESLAPLHNPANLKGIEVARRLCLGVPQIAVFDTAFHHTLPPYAAHYALPPEMHRQFHLRRYGFHGISVQSVTRRAAQLMGRPQRELNLIVLHLGNGASATAVENGRSVDTSMGMTPLEGLMMGTRCGDLDPAAHFHLLRHGGFTPDQLEHLLFHRSGFKGMCGVNDLREVHARAERGDGDAALALELFCYRVRKYVGAYAAVLGRVDAVVFTAGIGEHDAEVRERSLDGLGPLGVAVDQQRNRAPETSPRAVHAPDSRTEVWIIPTDEEWEIARSVIELTRMSPGQGVQP